MGAKLKGFGGRKRDVSFAVPKVFFVSPFCVVVSMQARVEYAIKWLRQERVILF